MDFGAPELGPAIRDLGCFDIVICLAVINAISNRQLALRTHGRGDRGELVLEYAALETGKGKGAS